MITGNDHIWRGFLVRCILALLVIFVLSLPFLQNLAA